MKINKLSKVYKTRYEDVTALEDISLILPSNGLVFIVGVSGSGKTTLMNMLSGVDTPTTGEVKIGEKSLFKNSRKEMFGYRNSYVGLVFQDYNLIEDLNVYDNIKLPFELLGQTDFSRVDEVIKKVDIEEIKYSKVTEISSGQMQRVAIARALIKDSSLILADEPTGNLDTKNEKIIFDLLKEISKERLVVVITHGDEVAQIYGDRIIEIEDGNIRSDSDPIKDVVEETPVFVQPKIGFQQQVRFTKGFIRNNLGRSLSILIVLLLVPLIGGILSGYVFYDASVGYRDYQDKYNSNYLSLSQAYDNFDLYYTSEEVDKFRNKYPETTFMSQQDINVDINPNMLSDDFFYRPMINYLIIYENNLKLDGKMPEDEKEIAVTDYVLESIKHYQGVEEVTQINIFGNMFDIVGVIDTDYEKFKGINFIKDDYSRMAFEENLSVYNAIYTSPLGRLIIFETMQEYTETVSYTVNTGKPKADTYYSDIVISRVNDADMIYGDYRGTRRYGIISQALFEKIGWEYEDIDNSRNLIFYSYSKVKYVISFRVTGIYKSDELGVIISGEDFYNFTMNDLIQSNRLVVSKDDVNYTKLIENENITNESFNHASNMREKAEGSKIVMIEFLIVLIVIIIAFSTIINSMTVVSEKKKIGIKYSFGLKKLSIIIPYIFETVFYIIIGFLVSSVIVKYVFPWLMQSVIYTKEVDIKAFDFFYISWTTIMGWDLLIYVLMLVNLTVMILNIVRKSPIEIIKDL